MQGSNRTTGSSRLSGSVFIKGAGLVAATAILVAAMVLTASTRSAYGIVKEHLANLLTEVSVSYAGNLAGHLKFGKLDAVEPVIAEYAERSGDHFVQVAVWNAEGERLLRSGTATADQSTAIADLARRALETGEIAIDRKTLTVGVPVLYGNGTTVGAFGAVWTSKGLMSEIVANSAPLMSVAGVIFLMMLGIATVLLRRMIGVPLDRVSVAMKKVADGAYDAEIPMTDNHDEVGIIARSLDALRDRLQRAAAADAELDGARAAQAHAVEQLGRGLNALATGDLTHTLDQTFAADYEQLRHDFNATVATLNEMLASIVENATEIHARAEEIGGASDDLSHRTENQAATLEETAAALDELTGSVR
ncbi:HAMP domain-containing protein, partial [Rhodovulum marinum]